MTSVYKLTSVKVQGRQTHDALGCLDRHEVDIDIEWVSTGIYALSWQGDIAHIPLDCIEKCLKEGRSVEYSGFARQGISIDPEHLDKIIELYPNAPDRSKMADTFSPFFEELVFERGMLPGVCYLRAFKDLIPGWIIIQEQNAMFGRPSKYLQELVITFDDLIKLRNACNTPELDKPIHYVQCGW